MILYPLKDSLHYFLLVDNFNLILQLPGIPLSPVHS